MAIVEGARLPLDIQKVAYYEPLEELYGEYCKALAKVSCLSLE